VARRALGGRRALGREVVDGAGRPRAASWMGVMASLKRGSERQGEFEVLGDVFG
jgi:hypothetical protein